MRDEQTTEQTLKIELLSQWKLEAEFRKIMYAVAKIYTQKNSGTLWTKFTSKIFQVRRRKKYNKAFHCLLCSACGEQLSR